MNNYLTSIPRELLGEILLYISNSISWDESYENACKDIENIITTFPYELESDKFWNGLYYKKFPKLYENIKYLKSVNAKADSLKWSDIYIQTLKLTFSYYFIEIRYLIGSYRKEELNDDMM